MDGAAADILLQTFNDFNESMSIITYVKVRVCRLIISDID
jgi:ubiquitin thioesterase protein OTUB1